MPGADQWGHHIVCGLGHVGYRVVMLLRGLDIPVSVVYDHAPEEWLRQARDAGAECFAGDARDDRLLQQAGICHARTVIAATDQDLVNLSVALDARRLNPGVGVVVRMYDLDLARHVEESLGARQVLSTSALAAPVFVSAALGQEVVGHFTVEGKPFVVVSRTREEAAQDGESLLTLFSLDAESSGEAPVKDTVLGVHPAPAGDEPAGRGRRRRAAVGHALAAALDAVMQVPRTVRLLLSVLVAIVLLGVVVSHLAMGLSLVDALYFVVTTITTVGYGDISFSQSEPAVKLFGCILMLAGAALLATLFGIVTDAILSHRLRELLVRRPTHMRQHVIVAGGGHIGERIVQQLTEAGHGTVLLSADADLPGRAAAAGAHAVQGDARTEAALALAGVQRAAAIIAVDDDDVANLGVCLLAKKLNGQIRTVARVFDSVLAGKLQSQLDVDSVLSISAVSAPAFVAAALFRSVELATLWQDRLLVIQGGGATDAERGEHAVAMGYRVRDGALTMGAPQTSGGDTRLLAQLLPVRRPDGM